MRKLMISVLAGSLTVAGASAPSESLQAVQADGGEYGGLCVAPLGGSRAGRCRKGKRASGPVCPLRSETSGRNGSARGQRHLHDSERYALRGSGSRSGRSVCVGQSRQEPAENLRRDSGRVRSGVRCRPEASASCMGLRGSASRAWFPTVARRCLIWTAIPRSSRCRSIG